MERQFHPRQPILPGPITMNQRMHVMQRQPRRISITLSHQVHESLLCRSEEEGRSLSNLCAFLLEEALRHESQVSFEMTGPPMRPAMAMVEDGHRPSRHDDPREQWLQRH